MKPCNTARKTHEYQVETLRKRMKPLIKFKATILPVLILFALGYFVIPQRIQAVLPPPDGGYPGANTAEGQQALLSLSGGTFNTALGWSSLKSNIAGNYNTGVGAGALVLNTSDQNTATGAGALLLNTSGFRNTANGAFALLHNNAADNTGIGNAALFSNTTGSGNTATGNFALIDNDTGSNNTATGNGALSANTNGGNNTAVGAGALAGNTSSDGNTAIGSGALASGGGSSSSFNTAIGYQALFNNTDGFFNVAIGHHALFNQTLAIDNIALGANAGSNVVTADNVICIGTAVSGANVGNTCFIGNIFGVTTGGVGSPVLVDSSGQLGTMSSSRRFKKDIGTMGKASEAILSLKPVTFHYKSDKTGTPQFGLIAEEVAKVNPTLVLPDKEGKPYTVRYDAVNAMLLNEFLKAHHKIEEQEATIAQLKQDFQSKLAEQQKQIEALTAGLQKVSAQVEMNRTAPQMVVNNQ